MSDYLDLLTIIPQLKKMFLNSEIRYSVPSSVLAITTSCSRSPQIVQNISRKKYAMTV